MPLHPTTDDPTFSSPALGNPDEVSIPKSEKPASPKNNRLLTIALVAGIVLVVIVGIFMTIANLGNASEATPTSENQALPPGFPTATPTTLFGLPPTQTPVIPPGFDTSGSNKSSISSNTTTGKYAVVCYSTGGKCIPPASPTQPFANANEYLDKHIGTPNAALNTLDPGFANGTYGKIIEVKSGATEDKGQPYSYNNGMPNHGDPASACLFQPVDRATGANIGQPAWVACGGLILQP